MNNWFNHPGLKNIDPVKLELMKTAISSTNGKTGTSLAPILLSLITTANKKNIRFSPEEIGLIMEVMKEGKSPAEQEQIDKTAQTVKNILKSKR